MNTTSCLPLLAAMAVHAGPAAGQELQVMHPTVNGRVNPLGITADRLTFGWALTAATRGTYQRAYQIRLGTRENESNTWDSQRVESDQQVGVVLPESIRLAPATRYWWQVRTWDARGAASSWSQPAWFETGLLSRDDWQGAHWITRPGKNPFDGGNVTTGALTVAGNNEAVLKFVEPLPLLRGTFEARHTVRDARVYAGAHGLYQLTLNGQKVGDQFLAPGWTDYNRRLQSQTYDVSGLVRPGANVLGAALADGWYKGKVGIGWKQVYGDNLAFIARVKVTYTDGSVEWFSTDEGWKAGDSPRLAADLQDGEAYDARLEQSGWDQPYFVDTSWKPAKTLAANFGVLVPQPDEPVRTTATLPALLRTSPAPGVSIYDLGQNMVGVSRITMTGKKGDTAQIRYAEELYRTGERRGQLYTDNFRSAEVTEHYTFARDETVTYEPTFTQHGFRYIEITGLEAAPKTGAVWGLVRGSDLPNTGDLITSDPMLNQLVRNTRWGQRGNFVSIPTDTPARDERLGWTGDISVFAPTASYFQDTRAFLGKWMDDVRDSQRPDGNIPAVVPQPRNEFDETGVGWSDAFITVPYAVWRATGDDAIVQRNWVAMTKFYEFVRKSSTRKGMYLEEGRKSWFSGDWLNLEDKPSPQEHAVIGTAYFAENTRMMAEMAASLGETARAQEWAELVPHIRQAFAAAYVQPDGTVVAGTQTVYAMALGMDLIAAPALRAKVAAKFLEKLEADHFHLRTGFLGTPWLLPALSSINRPDLAMRLLQNEDYPSWGFEVKMGATTMWERWNTIRPDGEFGPVEMNSFNHYAYGAVADWMFRHIGGLQPIEPGYKRSRLAPLVAQGALTSARGDLQTSYGLLACHWSLADKILTIETTVPVNTSAEILIPARRPSSVFEGSTPAVQAVGVESSAYSNGVLTLRVGSGNYKFTVKDGE